MKGHQILWENMNIPLAVMWMRRLKKQMMWLKVILKLSWFSIVILKIILPVHIWMILTELLLYPPPRFPILLEEL